MNTKILEDIGFTSKESDVYMVIIGSNEIRASDIMKKTNVSRKSVYEILYKLLSKGLISKITKDNKKYFKPTHPEKLFDIIRNQEIELKKKEMRLKASFYDILKKYNEKKKEETKFEIFVGKEGMKTVSSKVLKEGKPLYVFDNEGEIFDFLKYHMPQHIKKEEKIKLPVKVIFIESARKKKLSFSMAEARYIPDNYSSPISISIYGDNVHILIFSKDNPLALYIKSKEISESFMNYFNLMWKIAKE